MRNYKVNAKLNALSQSEDYILDRSKRVSQFPRIVRPAPEPLGLYFRVGRNDHKAFSDLIAAGGASLFGAVLDPTNLKRHAELRDQIRDHEMDVILDPKTQESATPGGFKSQLSDLPWGVSGPHRQSDFAGTAGKRLISALAQFALDEEFTQVMSPTHLLRSADDPWLDIDVRSAQRFREQLDRRGGSRIPIIYPLAVPYSTIRDPRQRRELIEKLQSCAASAIWLQVDGAGATGSATQALNYIRAASEMHELGIPLVADHIGGLLGLALLAFGAVGGMAHGITLGERFDTKHWRRQNGGKGFLPTHRVYVGLPDLMLERKEAQRLMNISPRAKARFGCADTNCCRRGISDMLKNPALHFMIQRIRQVADLSPIPEQLRAQRFLERSLRPASDAAVAATNIDWGDRDMQAKMDRTRKRLDSMRVALSAHTEARPPVSYALHPERRVTREKKV